MGNKIKNRIYNKYLIKNDQEFPDYKEITLSYEKTIGGHLADKPMFLENDPEEKCICITHKDYKIYDVFDYDKPKKIENSEIYFNELKDRKCWVSLCLFTKDSVDVPKNGHAEWGYQLALVDKGTHYLIDYRDHFITGDARGGDDFQELTSSWQW
jgi:hypothetical protein